MYKKVYTLISFMLMFLVFALNTLAQPNKPDGFCNGGVGWPYLEGEDAQDPVCGAGRLIVHFDAGGYQGEEYAYNWPHAEWLLEGHGRNGTFWFEPASWYANDYVNAPAGFCNGGIPWNFGITQRPYNPNCGPGQYVIHYDAGGYQGENLQASWEGAEITRWGQSRTLWYEPEYTHPQAPGGFCNGGVPWVLEANSLPINPNCPVGRYSVDYNGFSGFRYDWGSAISTLGNRAGTFWYEPENWYAGTPIPATPEPLPVCPAGYGSRTGIYPGDYDIDRLNNEFGVDYSTQIRQDLFEMFGNSGQVPAGYGGQGCQEGHVKGGSILFYQSPPPQLSQCPAGYGSRTGIYPGDYDAIRLVQDYGEPMATDIRQDLYEMFGNSGQAPAGYAGEGCQGGHVKWNSIYFYNPLPAPTDPPTSNPTEEPPSDPIPGTTTIEFYYPNFNHTYTLEVSKAAPFCYIENGAEVIGEEVVRFNNWISTVSLINTPFAFVDYLAENKSGIESLREGIEGVVTLYMDGCPGIVYLVGSRSMDTSGLGNVMYGYATVTWPDFVSSAVANWAQRLNEQTISNINSQCGGVNLCSFKTWIGVSDNEDDQSQARMGNRLAELTLYQQGVTLDYIPPATIIQAANDTGVH